MCNIASFRHRHPPLSMFQVILDKLTQMINKKFIGRMCFSELHCKDIVNNRQFQMPDKLFSLQTNIFFIFHFPNELQGSVITNVSLLHQLHYLDFPIPLQ